MKGKFLTITSPPGIVGSYSEYYLTPILQCPQLVVPGK